MRQIMAAGVWSLGLCAAALLGPDRASAASCITTVAGDVCLAHCIGTQQKACVSDPACHQAVVDVLQMLAQERSDTQACATLADEVRQLCGCVASPSGAFLD